MLGRGVSHGCVGERMQARPACHDCRMRQQLLRNDRLLQQLMIVLYDTFIGHHHRLR